MSLAFNKLVNVGSLAGIYKDLRDRMKEIEVPVEDVMVDGASVVVNGIANIPAIPTVPVTDVQINSNTILQNGIANIPVGGSNTLGVFKVFSGYGITAAVDGCLTTDYATDSQIKSGSNRYSPITPERQDKAVFYGLSKVAGEDLKNATVTVGTYPDASKQAIQKLFGLDGILGDYESATASKAYAIGETFIYNGKRYRATVAIAQGDVIAPGTNCELDPLDGKYIRNTDIAITNGNSPGLVKIISGYGVYTENDGTLVVKQATSSQIKAGSNAFQPVMPARQHESVFYALSKLAGVDLKNETVTVGTYPATAKAAILAMLGAVASDAKADATNLGLVMVGDGAQYGVTILSNGMLRTLGAYNAQIKAGTDAYRPIVPEKQDVAVFYGLSKLAGQDLKNSDTPVGTYPQSSKTAIQTMLGIEADIPLVETITGATPTITGAPNVRYICETAVSELTITPPASGSIVVRFTAGSNCVVSLPQTVKLPEWFDISSLEAGTTYELIITDGVYGGVMSWAA